MTGPNFDGHAYAAKALAAGASAVLVSHRPDGLPADAPVLLVEDTFAALQDLGSVARLRAKARIVAVTGSVGKTSTKEALAVCLGALAPTFATAGSLNNHWGVPLSLARMPADSVYAVFELGMNHAGEIGPLSRQVQPDVAVITTIEAVHLEYLQLGRSHRGRQGRDLRRHVAQRDRGAQPRQPALRKAGRRRTDQGPVAHPGLRHG